MRAHSVVAIVAAFATILSVSASHQALAQAKQAPAAQAQPPAPPPLKQMALTDAQINSFLAAQAAIDAVTSALPPGDPGKPDPKIQAQVEDIVKKNGFASLPEYGEVFGNIALVMSGIDSKTRTFTDPPDAIAREIASVQASKQMVAMEKASALAQLRAAQAATAKVQFTENVALVTKYYDKLAPLFAHEDEDVPPPPAKGAPKAPAKKK